MELEAHGWLRDVGIDYAALGLLPQPPTPHPRTEHPWGPYPPVLAGQTHIASPSLAGWLPHHTAEKSLTFFRNKVTCLEHGHRDDMI